MELSGAVGVVTGGARGLGKAIAEALAARGVKLALVDALTGRWVDATADFDRIFARAEEIVDSNLLVLRLRGLDKQGGGR